MDEWKETWDWAHEVWGPRGKEDDYSFHRFFQGIAARVAKAEGWEEIGSSDVWHASYHTVKQLKVLGTVKTREQLMEKVRSYMGFY